jgi:AcrR family transcriptional regulator
VSERRRLSVPERRRELIRVGADLFAALPYESVLMEDVAARAGVSRALVYKYFPSKRDLFAAVYRQAADVLLDSTRLDPGVPLLDQVRAGLDTHLDYFEANRDAVLTANRTLAGDPTVQAIIVGELATLRARVIEVSGLRGHPRDVLTAVLTGWLVFVRALVVDWLGTGLLSRAELRDACLGALTGALGDLADDLPGGPARESRPAD